MSNPPSPDPASRHRLKLAQAEIEAVLKKYDLAGVVGLHTPGASKLFFDLSPSYSCIQVGSLQGARTPLVVLPPSGDPSPTGPQPDLLSTSDLLQRMSAVTLDASFLFQHLSHHFEVKTRITK